MCLTESDLKWADSIAAAICGRNVHYHAHVEDAAAEARIALWRVIERYDAAHGTTLRQWANSRVAGAVWDYLRHVGVVARNGNKTPTTLPLDKVARRIADQSMQSTYEPAAVARALAVLNPRQREAVERTYWLDQNQNEIAHEMGVGTSRVSQILRRAHRKMVAAFAA